MGEMATTVKTAVLLQKDLFDRAEAVAGEMRVPKSRLFSVALESFLDRRESVQILERVDATCSGGATPEERDLAGAMLLHRAAFPEKATVIWQLARFRAGVPPSARCGPERSAQPQLARRVG
jgi:hypothetical protein